MCQGSPHLLEGVQHQVSGSVSFFDPLEGELYLLVVALKGGFVSELVNWEIFGSLCGVNWMVILRQGVFAFGVIWYLGLPVALTPGHHSFS